MDALSRCFGRIGMQVLSGIALETTGIFLEGYHATEQA